MTAPRQRLAARDYKHGGRAPGSFDLMRYRQFALGLALGLGVALVVWLRGQQMAADAPPPVPIPDAVAAPAAEADPAADYAFYELLPNSKVEVAEEDRRAVRTGPAEPITRPGAYVLQVHSVRNRAEAERERDRLQKQGMDVNIQRVTVDENEWHRVRVGPSRDLDQINAWREQLRQANVDVTVYLIGE